MTAGPTETTVITYGTWASDDTGFTLEGKHEVVEDQDSLSLEATVIVKGATEAQLASRVAAMQAQLNTEHQRLTVDLNGTTSHDYTGVLADVSGSAPAAAQSVAASARLIGSHFAALSQAFRLRIEVLKPALQTGKIGKRNQRIRYTQTPNGIDVLEVSIEFTPDASGNSARVVSADGGNGFDARVTEIFTSLGLTQSEFEGAGKVTGSDEDDRAVTVSETYRQLPFPQSASGTDDPALTDVFYSNRVVRPPVSAAAEFNAPGRLAQLTVTFSAALKFSGTQLDPDAVIRSTVLPYVTNTIAPRATVSGSRVLMGHSLKFNDLPVPSVAGSVFYLVPEGTLLSASAILDEQDFFGTTYEPIRSKTNPYKVAQFDGPGKRVVLLVVATEEIGDANPELDAVATSFASQLFRQGFKPVAEGKKSQKVRRSFQSPDGSGEIRTSIRVFSQQWRYAPNLSKKPGKQRNGGSRGGTAGNLRGGSGI